MIRQNIFKKFTISVLSAFAEVLLAGPDTVKHWVQKMTGNSLALQELESRFPSLF